MDPKLLTSGANALLQKAIRNFKAINGRAPLAHELAQIEQQAAKFSIPTSGLRTGMSAGPRASYELATDPNLINPNTARDAFLTKMTTGRTTKGTNLRPIAQDVTDPSVVKNIEAQQMGGQLDELIPGASQGSTTPSADYFAEVSKNIENSALEGGSLDALKQAFYKKQGRYPGVEELDSMIAEFNPARHQYGQEGISIMSQRPPTAKGMTDWRNAARLEGVPESYLTKRQGNYPQYIQDELQIQRGELPTTGMAEAKKKARKEVEPVDFYIDENGNPVKIYPTMKADGGQITPRDMLAQMIVNQITPQKFAKGAAVKNIATNAGINAALDPAYMLNTAREAGKQFGKKNFAGAANSTIDLASAVSPYFLVPSIYQAGRAMGNVATEQLARNPVARKQMQSMSDDYLGGALAGDTGLAAQILGNRDYEDVLAERHAEEIAAQEEANRQQVLRDRLNSVVLKEPGNLYPITYPAKYQVK